MALSERRSRVVFIVIGITMVITAVLVVWFVPREQPELSISRIENPEAVARVRMTVDAVDGARSAMKLRLAAGPTEKPMPPEGITIFTNVDSVSTVKLQPGTGSQEASLEVPLARGEISAYPFDDYVANMRISAEKGTPNAPTAHPDGGEIPIEVDAYNSAVGFDIEIDGEDIEPNAAILRFDLNRTKPTVTWVSIMMAMYWLLSFAVISVTALVVMRLREWESRHLAWLATMIFAFASFRATAPGSPPFGVYLDYAAFFWAEVLVALSLMTLVGFYLLGLSDPERLRSARSEAEIALPEPDQAAAPVLEAGDAAPVVAVEPPSKDPV